MEFTPAPAIRLEFTEIIDQIYSNQLITEDSMLTMMSVLDAQKALFTEEKSYLQIGLINHSEKKIKSDRIVFLFEFFPKPFCLP